MPFLYWTFKIFYKNLLLDISLTNSWWRHCWALSEFSPTLRLCLWVEYFRIRVLDLELLHLQNNRRHLPSLWLSTYLYSYINITHDFMNDLWKLTQTSDGPNPKDQRFHSFAGHEPRERVNQHSFCSTPW